MNKLIRFSLPLFCFLLTFLKAAAQYEDILQPQYEWEVAVLKKNHILAEQLYVLDEKGQKVHFQNRVYNSDGQMLLSYDAAQRKYFAYDDKGRVVSYMDSSQSGDNWNVNEYHFSYNNDGRLKSIASTRFNSTFTYDASVNLLREKLIRGDTVSYNNYYYTKAGKLRELVLYNDRGERLRHDLYFFGDKGRLNKESKTVYGGSGHDSVMTIYQYDNNNVMTGKIVFTFMEMLMGAERNGVANMRGTHYESAHYTYKYDNKGQLVADLMTCKENPLSEHTFLYTYDNRGLRIKESYRRGKVDPHVIIRDYIVNQRN